MMMRFSLLCATLVLAVTAAKADSVDFNMSVLDPPMTISYTPEYSTDFPVTFESCSNYILPNGVNPDGCFGAVNATGGEITSLMFTIPNSGPVTNSPTEFASCDVSANGSVFGSDNCPPDPTNDVYTLTFSGGSGIAEGEPFIITETGVPLTDDPSTSFPTFTAVATVAPEPPASLLVSTGGVLLGLARSWRSRWKKGSSPEA